MTKPDGFSARLLRYRAEKGLTQKDLAHASGVSVPQIARYEIGASRPRLTALVRLARALQVEVEQLQGISDGPSVAMDWRLPKDVIHFLESQSRAEGVTPEAMLTFIVRSHIALKNGVKLDNDLLLGDTSSNVKE